LLFDKGSQGDRLQKRNAELEAELNEARHALIVALQDRRELRRFYEEWYAKNEELAGRLMDRAMAKMPGEE